MVATNAMAVTVLTLRDADLDYGQISWGDTALTTIRSLTQKVRLVLHLVFDDGKAISAKKVEGYLASLKSETVGFRATEV